MPFAAPESKINQVFDDITNLVDLDEHSKPFQIARLKREISQLPEFEHRWALMAILLVLIDRFDDAYSEIEKLFTLSSIEDASINNVCLALHKRGLIVEALDIMVRATQKYDNPAFPVEAGQLYAELFDMESAREYLEIGAKAYKFINSEDSDLVSLQAAVSDISDYFSEAEVDSKSVNKMYLKLISMVNPPQILTSKRILSFCSDSDVLAIHIGLNIEDPSTLAELNSEVFDTVSEIPEFDPRVVMSFYPASSAVLDDAD